MRTMLLAAAAALSLGIGSAYAGDGEGPIPNTRFTEQPNFIAQAPVQSNHAYAANQNGSDTSLYATQHRTVSVFPWNQNEGVGG